MKSNTIIAYVVGILTIAGGALLTPVNSMAGSTLMAAGAWWLGKVQKQPRFAKKVAADMNGEITPPPVTIERPKP